MKKIILVAIFCFYFGISFAQMIGNQNIEDAEILMQKEDWVNALRYLNDAENEISDEKNALWQFMKLRKTECLLRLGKTEEARKTAENLLPKIPSDNARMYAETVLLHGEILLNSAENDNALRQTQAALELFEKHFSGDIAQISQAYNLLGLIFWSTRKQNMALDYLQKALDLRLQNLGSGHEQVAAIYNNIGLVYSQAGENDKAQEFYENALYIYQNLLNDFHPKLANAYNNLGVIFWQKNDYGQAIYYFEEALKVYEQNPDLPTVNKAFVFNYLAQVEIDKEAFDKAKNYAQNALLIYTEKYGKKHPEIAKTYNLLGKIALSEQKSKRKQSKNALQFYQNALKANSLRFEENNFEKNPVLNDFYDANVMLNTLLLKAQAFEKLYQTSSLRNRHLYLALESLEKADSLTDKVRQSLRAKGDQIALSARVREVHEDAVRIALTLSKVHIRSKFYLEKAFYFAEKSKSAALLSAVSDSEAKSFADISPELLAEEKSLKDSIAFYEQKLAEKPSENDEKSFRNALFSLNQKYQNFILNLEKNYPEYFRLKYDVKTANAAEVRKNLPEDALLMSYFIAEKTNRLIIFCLNKSGIFVEDVPQDENFKQLFVGLRNAIKFKSDNLYQECASKLYKQLIPGKIPSKTRQLILIPDGILSSIPFECLLRKELKNKELDYNNLPYLIRDFAVNYAFSASLFLQNLKKMTQKKVEKNIMVCAPVRFKNNKLGDLPATETEAEMICQKISGENLRLTFDNAHESKIKSGLLKNFAYLHFATHGTVDEINPELSKIFLAQSQHETQEDGCLFAGEIYNLSLNADLVTLSACETGLGKQMKGEGIIGLSRAFLYAGAKNLIVSLWSVADESTANFMIDFYEKTAQNNAQKGFSESLQTAKKNMIQHEKYSAPYYWAAFILIGN